MTAAERWARELAGWAIDPEILARAPESPWTLPPELFRAHHRPSSQVSPLVELARAALPDGGSVLDVGVGAGATSLPLLDRAGLLVAVDSQASMLEEVSRVAARPGTEVTTVLGEWPAVAADVPVCDVVVCAHVAYNVSDLPAFATALTEHARRRVVLELHARHPSVGLGPLWEHFHHQPRPAGPTAELAIEVLAEAGITPSVQRWAYPALEVDAELEAVYVSFTRRRLCLPVEREPEVAEQLARQTREPRESVVLWWDA